MRKKKPKLCIDCGKEITGSKRCKECFYKLWCKPTKRCLDCNKIIQRRSIRCQKCSVIYRYKTTNTAEKIRKGVKKYHKKAGHNPLSIINQIRHSDNYKKWRNDIFKRDNFTCQYCNKKGKIIAHHIKYFNNVLKEYKIKHLNDAQKCSILWDINNGITLCEKCHKILHSNDGYSKSLNRGDFVIVTWYDAITHKRAKLIDLNKPPKELLAICISFGVLFKQDENAIVIMHEDAGDEADFTVIPNSWLNKIEKVNGRKRYIMQTQVQNCAKTMVDQN